MKVTCERLEDSQVRLHIEVDPERAAKSVDQAYHRLVNRISIPGFRKGKAPRHVVERMIGHEALVQEAIELLLPEVFREAVAETGIEPIDKPEVDIVQEQPLVLNMTVPVWPTVELGDYHDIHVEREPVQVGEEKVDEVVQHLREQHAEWLPVERPAAAGDRVTIDVVGHIRGAPVLYGPEGGAILETQTGEPVVDQKNVEYTVTPEGAVPLPGFAEQLVGLSAGVNKRFELNFPPGYPDRELANKAVIFQVTVHGVKEKQLLELDDEFAKTVGDYETLDALRQTIRENLQQRMEREARNRLSERVLGMVTDQLQVQLPPTLVEREVDRLVERAERNLRQANVSMDDFLHASKKSKQDLRADYRADAIANLRRFFALAEVAKREQVTATPEEVEAEIHQLSEALTGIGATAKATAALYEPERRAEVSEDLRRRKALERLVAIATGEVAGEPAQASEPKTADSEDLTEESEAQ